MKLTYDNTIKINETFINNCFTFIYNYYIGFLCDYPTTSPNIIIILLLLLLLLITLT
jgi:hypothetical protein